MIKKMLIFTVIFFLGIISTVEAKIDWQEGSRFKADAPILDIATSFDGKYVFVLSTGKIQIFSNRNNIEDTILVDSSLTSISVVGFKRGRIDNKIILSSRETGEIQVINYDEIVFIDTKNAPFKGSAEAPVTLVVFSDFQ